MPSCLRLNCLSQLAKPKCCLLPVAVCHVGPLCKPLQPQAQSDPSHRTGVKRRGRSSQAKRTRPKSCAAIVDSATRTMSPTSRMLVLFSAMASLPPLPRYTHTPHHRPCAPRVPSNSSPRARPPSGLLATFITFSSSASGIYGDPHKGMRRQRFAECLLHRARARLSPIT